MEDQEMIQTFSPHTSKKTFADSICPARVWYGVRSTLIPLVVATRAKFDPNFLSLSRSRYFGVYPYGVASRSGTRHPGIGWRARHIHMDHLSRLQFDEEESKKRAKEEIGHL